MIRATSITIPTLVRIKYGALDRLGVYVTRGQFKTVALVMNKGLDEKIIKRAQDVLAQEGIRIIHRTEVVASSFEQAQDIFQTLPHNTGVIIGLGGGKALDIAKYVAFLSRLPYVAVPTALSNDGFCSPQSSLEFKGKRRSFPAAMPYGVVVDTKVCLEAPRILWLSGIGDIVSKITAVYDWKLSFKLKGTQVDDFSALLSDATVFQLMAKPDHDLEGIRLLATALMLNGIAMEICGSSRPASGSEHLISHAYDLISKRPRLHGLQVGVATYMVSLLQGRGADRISKLFHDTGFWDEVRKDPFNRAEWIEAIKYAPFVKPDFTCILSEADRTNDLVQIMDSDESLQGVFQ